MKTKILILFFATILVGSAKAQNDTVYHLQHFLPDSAQFITCFGGVEYTIAGDTLINGKKMKKVYNPNQYYAAIYEDTLNAKYYAVYKDDTKEKLFMDFSVKEGDIVTVSDKYGTKDVQVNSVQFDKTGRKNISVGYGGGWNPDEWMEGVGSLLDVLIPNVSIYGIADISGPEAVARVVIGDSIVYEQFTAADCKDFEQYRYNSINHKYANADISIYPNPAKDFLLIDTETFDCLTYEIISTSGAVLQNGELLPSINISSLPQGAKLIVVKNDNGEIVYLNKFIKQ